MFLDKTIDRKLKIVSIPMGFLGALCRPGGPIAYEVIEGVPPTAMVIGCHCNNFLGIVDISFYDESFPEVLSGAFPHNIEITCVSYVGDAFEKREKEYDLNHD